MAPRELTVCLVLLNLALACQGQAPEAGVGIQPGEANALAFAGKGVVEEIKPDGKTIVIRHDAIPNYMEAMTMPFKIKDPRAAAALQIGDAITFRLRVADDESWIEDIAKAGTAPIEKPANAEGPAQTPNSTVRRPLLDYFFTNELGRPMSLGGFHGQALAITFFFTRCPVPDFCPRLSRNFQEASRQLASLPGAPTNWHFLSITFDPTHDTPGVLKNYAQRYDYDPAHWSFLTGPPDKISELARLCGVTVNGDGGLLNHNFRTMIIDAAGRHQTTFMVGGNLSTVIVDEIVKAAAVVNQPAAKPILKRSQL